MLNNIHFRDFMPSDREVCLHIFDENCPSYFAINEREDYADFLDCCPEGYEVCVVNNHVVGAYGITEKNQHIVNLNWILISPKTQGVGVGHQFMTRAIERANHLKVSKINIAASHLSAPFFSKYGAKEVGNMPDGWGVGMHRVDMELVV